MFREMEYVYAVYQARSFTKAAEAMYLSQPALSSMVKKAERKIGAPLFDRSTSPLSLTPAGEYYIQQAEKIRQIQQETQDHFSRITRDTEHTIRICGAAIYQAYVFPAIIASFREQYPDIQISWIEERTGLVQRLLTDEVDLFPEVNNYISKEVDAIAWKNEEIVLVVPKALPVNEILTEYRYTPLEIRQGRHRIPDAKTVDLTMFRDESFVMMDEENDTFQRAVTICSNAGFVPKAVSMKPAQMLTAYQLAARSSVSTFVSDTLVEHADTDYPFYIYKLSDPQVRRQQFLYFRRGDSSASGRLFREFLLKVQSQKGAI